MLSETQRFAPNGARNKVFPTVAAYKHLAPNGAKTQPPKIQSDLLRELKPDRTSAQPFKILGRPVA